MVSRYDMYSVRYPLLPLKNVVIFPRNVVTLLVGRTRSIQAVEEAMSRDRRIVVVAHRDASVDDPRPDDLYQIGTLAEIVSIEHQQGGNIQVALEGLSRVEILQFDGPRPFYTVRAEPAVERVTLTPEAQALVHYVRDLARQHQEAKNTFSSDVMEMVRGLNDPSHLADLLTTQLIRDASQRQSFLENLDPLNRLEMLAVQLATDLDLASLEQRIKERVREQIDKNQREYFLREQLKAIHDELSGEGGNEMEALREKIRARKLPQDVEEKLLREVSRLERMPTVSAEGTVVRNYIDTLLALPWTEMTEDNLDLDHAEQVLNADHFGLDHVKERIIEFLAVRKLTQGRGAIGAQILCLVGPPGVGKTSLGRSIATAMGRKLVRVSLGGVRDEAEIRGHRRTYIGAFPGRIIGAMKTAGTINPVIVLDEIDKMASDYRGDPAAAMLEVLDPEQNHAFNDHYLDVPYDLSKVMFIATANSLYAIPKPLRDRMEIIEISGYTEHEKIEIGRRHLLPKQLDAHGLAPDQIEIPQKVWMRIIRGYTREAGVRNLERQIASICRKVARDVVVKGRTKRVRLTLARLEDYLGPERYGFDPKIGESQVGVAIGLGTTEVGGELIPVEVAVMPGRGSLTITGRAGDVMQESARAALSYARSRADALGIEPDFQEKHDLHIHLPEGAIPKDGPSAGITMATALISALTKHPVRSDIAMTGEITLRGRVLPIGGLKEKTIAAHRVGIRRLIAPEDNRRDLVTVPEQIAADMEFIWVENMDQVIAEAIDFGAAKADIDPTLEKRLNESTTQPDVGSLTDLPVQDAVAGA
ncbi:endopeptidase La [Sphaerobacter thermophilus]|jgi:ATP-dependent Lon protease|uniref:Lon protease n=1 Tax=Sphaerobacter thermophilus (strain ATCC 49802 / DSM 20745 / KCCM 41009 / NCIMB 13125 / S 6022) TaxID=479434 RepID=D1C5L6_SPHTD|nr:endopeptidase La [Sphaerobacter thermophilus]ACZ37532.1 ATP-dependent protease La [Sphaerobacter thermophilus DSM 20745]PZN66066.1 MAG: endopeptidase La [Sphaerobacter thermophilus]